MNYRFFITCVFTLRLLCFQAQEWNLIVSSSVELRTIKLTNKADIVTKPLGGANIALYQGNTVVKQTKSNGSGDFDITIPADGEYMLVVSYQDCNPKKFYINTKSLPADFSKEKQRPEFPIDGVIMAKPLYSIDYSVLKGPLARIQFIPRQKKIDDDEDYTDEIIARLVAIKKAEDDLIARFLEAVKAGDAALKIPDCPLAKAMYEKALKTIPGEEYPTEQLKKVGLCLKEKEEAAKKAEEAAKAAAAKAEADKKAKEEADKLAKEQAAKAEADRKAKEEADRIAKEQAAKAEAERKAKEEALAKERAAKAEADKKAKEEADRIAKETAAKAETERKAKEEALAKERAAKAEADKKAKEEADRIAKETAAKAEAERKAKEEALAKEQAAKAEADKKAKEEADKISKEQAAKAEAARVANQQATEKAEAARLAKEQAAKEQASKAEADRIAKEQAAKAEAAKLANQQAGKAEAERLAKEKAAEKAEPDRIAREKAEKEKAETEKKKAEQLAREDEAKRFNESEKEQKEPRTGEHLKSDVDKDLLITGGQPYEPRTHELKNKGGGDGKYKIPRVLGKDYYKEAIDKADDYFRMKRYKEAKAAYEDALKHREGDPYAAKRLEETLKLLNNGQ